MSELAKGVGKLICVVKVKTGDDGKMFGTVTSGMIADELKHQFEVTLVWMAEEVMLPGRPYLLKLGARTVTAQVTEPKRFTCTPRASCKV